MSYMCCGRVDSKDDKPDGVCPECGTETIEGQAAVGCCYSPVECATCGWRPCDGSC